MDSIPIELIPLQFKYLDIRNLLKCRLVSNQWKDLASTSELWYPLLFKRFNSIRFLYL